MENIKEEQQPAAEHSLNPFAPDERTIARLNRMLNTLFSKTILKEPKLSGDDSTQEKPEAAAGDFPTENDKPPLSKCRMCGKVTDHGFFNCPDRERIRKLYPYCMVCNKGNVHDISECPNATEEVLKNLRYCWICDKNTDHSTWTCPTENGWTVYNGIRVPNVCDYCRVVGHVGQECPEADPDLFYDLGLCEDEW